MPEVALTFMGDPAPAVAATDKVKYSMGGLDKQVKALTAGIERMNLTLKSQAAAVSNVAVSSGRASTAHAKHSRELGNLEKSARGATGAFTGLGRAMFFASNAFISGIVIGGLLRQVVKATEDLQTAMALLGNAVDKNAGSWAQHRKQVEADLEALSKQSLFIKADLAQGLNSLVLATHNVTTAEKDLALATELARAKSIDLATAVRDVVLVSEGHASILRRQGIELPAVTTAMDALKLKLEALKNAHQHATEASKLHATALAKASDAAAAGALDMKVLAKEVGGADAVFRASPKGPLADYKRSLNDIELAIGRHVVPAIDHLLKELTRLNDYLRTSVSFHHQLRSVLEALEPLWIGLKTIVEGFANAMSNKVVRSITLVTAAVYLLDKAVLANPWAVAAAAAIYAAGLIVQHWTKIVHWFKALEVTLVAGFKNMWDEVQLLALDALKGILEPWSHLPSFLGGWARDAKVGVEQQMDALKNDMAANGRAVANAWGKSFHDIVVQWANASATDAQKAMMQAGLGGKPTPGGGMGTSVNLQPGQGGTGAGIVAVAKSQLGIPYKYGGPAKLGEQTDCSGLVQAVMRANGISVPRTADLQYSQAPIKNPHPLMAGDIVFYDSPHIGHVAIYIGGGVMIEDPHTGGHVQQVPLRRYVASARWWGKKGKISPGGSGSGPGTQAPGSQAGADALTGVPNAGSKPAMATLPSIHSAALAALQDIHKADALEKQLDFIGADASKYDKALRIKVEAWEKQLAADRKFLLDHQHLTAKLVAAIRERDREIAAAIAAGKAQVAAEIAAWKAKVTAAFQDMADKAMEGFDRAAQKMLDAFDKATAKFKTPTELLIEKLTDQHDQAALQDAVDQARKNLADAMTGIAQGADSATLAGVRDIVGKYSLAAAIDKAQSKILGGAPSDMSDQLLKDLQLALNPATGLSDPQAVIAAQKQLDDALYNQKLYFLQKTATAERSAYDEDRANQRDALVQMIADQRDALAEGLKLWLKNLLDKKVSWAEFIAWLKAHGYPVPGDTGGSGGGKSGTTHPRNPWLTGYTSGGGGGSGGGGSGGGGGGGGGASADWIAASRPGGDSGGTPTGQEQHANSPSDLSTSGGWGVAWKGPGTYAVVKYVGPNGRGDTMWVLKQADSAPSTSTSTSTTTTSSSISHPRGIGFFAKGGVVPGPVGSPQLAVVHGGETITPAGKGTPPIILEFHGDAAGLWKAIDGRVLANTDKISLKIGRAADRRRRAGHY